MSELSKEDVLEMLRRFDDEATKAKGGDRVTETALEAFKEGTRRLIYGLELITEREQEKPRG